MTTNQPTKAPSEQAPVVMRLLAAPDPGIVKVLTEAGWTRVEPDDGTPTWIRTGGDTNALAR